MSDLNREQVEILKHTIRIGRPFCGSGVDMDGLVGGGYMVCIGRKPFVPEPYYEITGEGRLYTPPEDKP